MSFDDEDGFDPFDQDQVIVCPRCSAEGTVVTTQVEDDGEFEKCERCGAEWFVND